MGWGEQDARASLEWAPQQLPHFISQRGSAEGQQEEGMWAVHMPVCAAAPFQLHWEDQLLMHEQGAK